jgi:hypothetical protein
MMDPFGSMHCVILPLATPFHIPNRQLFFVVVVCEVDKDGDGDLEDEDDEVNKSGNVMNKASATKTCPSHCNSWTKECTKRDEYPSNKAAI